MCTTSLVCKKMSFRINRSMVQRLAAEENLRFLAFEQMNILLMVNVGVIMMTRLLSLGVLRF